MLKQPVPSFARWLGGSTVVLALALLTGSAVWAAQPQDSAATDDVPAGKIRVQLSVQIDGSEARPPLVILSNPGELVSFEIKENGHLWELIASARVLDNGELHFSSMLQKDGTKVAEPVVTVDSGEPASITIGKEQGNSAFKGLQLDILLTHAAGATADATANTFIPVGEAGAVGSIAERNSRQFHPPGYPATAVAQRVSGKVVLVIDIDAQGKPTSIEVESAEPAGVFNQAAIDAAWQWKFDPRIENGEPVAGRVRVPVEFKIPPEPVVGEASNS